MNTNEEAIIEDGGPAFPVADTVYPSGAIQSGTYGMSLRDWFAGQALAGLCQNWNENPMNTKSCADVAYDLADAMLERRKK